MATNGRSLATGIGCQQVGSGDDLNCSVETVDRGEDWGKWVMAVTLQSWRQQPPKRFSRGAKEDGKGGGGREGKEEGEGKVGGAP